MWLFVSNITIVRFNCDFLESHNFRMLQILRFFNTKYLESRTLSRYLCGTFFFISLGLVRLVSLVSFSKRMEPPGSVLFKFKAAT